MAEPSREGYFHRVNRLTPTRFWINNPTLDEARAAIEAGAVSCTTNPAYAAKMAASGSDRARFRAALRESRAASPQSSPRELARAVQRRLVAPLLELFLPLFRASGGEQGYVSLQGDPFAEEETAAILAEAREARGLAPNLIAKVPVTESGLAAIEELVAEGLPVIATEVMSIAQAAAACESYERAARSSGRRPAFYVTHITGIFDEYLAEIAARDAAELPADVLALAGTAVARKQLRVMRERGCAGLFLGGGARALRHFTEFVGERAHVTINWRGTAEELVREDPAVVPRAGCPVPDSFIDALRSLPDFRRAYASDGLARSEFTDFGPVVRFRRSFEAGWRALLDEINSD